MVTSATPTSADRPVDLVAERFADDITLKVIGSSDDGATISFHLEVTSKTSGGSSSNSQSGNARLDPGAAVTLSTVHLGGVADATWVAKLHVSPTPGERYEVVRRSETGQ